MKEKIIAILTQEGIVGATIREKDGILHLKIRESTIESKINQVMSTVGTVSASLKIQYTDEDNVHHVGFKQVDTEDKEYLSALAEEINRRGLRAIVADESLLYLIELAAGEKDSEKRKQLVDELVEMSPDEIKSFKKDLEEAKNILMESSSE